MYWISFFVDADADKDFTKYVIAAGIEYLLTERPPPANTQPLTWWKMNALHYPFLSILAGKFLCTCILATSVPSEKDIFSCWPHCL